MISDAFLVGFDRKVVSNIKLSDGTILYPGETIAMASGAMSQDQSYYNDPQTFDGYRFHRARYQERNGTVDFGSEYSGIELGNLSWGHGRFSCPGMWYASLMMKLLLVTLILEYEFEFPEGQSVRPFDSVMDVHVLPDMKQKILIKKR